MELSELETSELGVLACSVHEEGRCSFLVCWVLLNDFVLWRLASPWRSPFCSLRMFKTVIEWIHALRTGYPWWSAVGLLRSRSFLNESTPCESLTLRCKPFHLFRVVRSNVKVKDNIFRRYTLQRRHTDQRFVAEHHLVLGVFFLN